MRQVFRIVKLFQGLEIADQQVFEMLHQVFADLCTPLSLLPTWVYLPLIFNTGSRKMMKETVAETTQTLHSQWFFLVFHAVHLVNEELPLNKSDNL